MKQFKLFTTIFFLGLCSLSSGQKNPSTDSTKAKDSTTLTHLSSTVDEILQRIKASKDDEKEPTGIIMYDTIKKIAVYTPNHKLTARTIIVNKVTLLVQDGYIIDIQVFAGGNIFTNTQAPISINGKRFSSQSGDYLFNKKNSQESIILQQALTYIPLSTFFPEDGLIILTNPKNVDTLRKNVGINSVLDLRLYTDALAAFGKEPNGLIQTQIKLKQFLHRMHYRNSAAKIFQYIKVDFTASKRDSKSSFVDSSSAISRSQLFQKSNVTAELLINIFGDWLTKKSLNNYYIDIGGNFNNIKLAGLKDTTNINVQSLFLEAGISLRSASNIGFDLNGRYIWQYSPQTDFNNQDVPVKFIRIAAEVFWNPFKEIASRIFGRINYTMGLRKSEKKNAFSQVQIGYSTLLSKAIGTK